MSASLEGGLNVALSAIPPSRQSRLDEPANSSMISEASEFGDDPFDSVAARHSLKFRPIQRLDEIFR